MGEDTAVAESLEECAATLVELTMKSVPKARLLEVANRAVALLDKIAPQRAPRPRQQIPNTPFLTRVAAAMADEYGDDFDEQPRDLAALQELRKRERGAAYDGVHPGDHGLPTQEDWLQIAAAGLRAAREPTEAMCAAAKKACGMEEALAGIKVLERAGIVKLQAFRWTGDVEYRAMIDEAVR